MDKKRFRTFLIGYVANIAAIAVLTVVLILAGKGILPDIFRIIGLVAIVADVIWFRRFASGYLNK